MFLKARGQKHRFWASPKTMKQIKSCLNKTPGIPPVQTNSQQVQNHQRAALTSFFTPQTEAVTVEKVHN